MIMHMDELFHGLSFYFANYKTKNECFPKAVWSEKTFRIEHRMALVLFLIDVNLVLNS